MCREAAQQLQFRDVTLDKALLQFLAHQELPGDPDERARVVKASQFFALDEAGKLWAKGV